MNVKTEMTVVEGQKINSVSLKDWRKHPSSAKFHRAYTEWKAAVLEELPGVIYQMGWIIHSTELVHDMLMDELATTPDRVPFNVLKVEWDHAWFNRFVNICSTYCGCEDIWAQNENASDTLFMFMHELGKDYAESMKDKKKCK